MSLPRTIDLHHLGIPGSMAAHVFDGVVVDPGCERTVHRVVEALGDEVPRAILLTHVHFDHAGGTGALLHHYPDAEVWVHEQGAHHMIDPTRLVASARRVFGEAFDLLWGEVVPVPERNVRVLRGDETIGDWAVTYTPGHAKHHVSFLHRPTRTAFTGDVTGIRIEGGPSLPPTPPPDIDPPAWHRSLDAVAAWEPERLVFMHFGQTTDAAAQIAAMHTSLDEFVAASRERDPASMADWIRAWVTERAGADHVQAYYDAGPFEGLWSGLGRWWSQQSPTSDPGLGRG